ncbi:helix-turn-helix domain-containing protein [Rhodococcus sp. PD04]|uniref:helix-turn-helix domain-containing protein n=1 Tax=Rhodococcus sp. PD04 TaxID=3109594 RepID=UPI002DDAA533|nr:helix-turn-helix domain-containing protein [Rhodococcus sp. PD04]WSE24383.1 helix-turn-helix domain-containing protein [Rhodococcus sp. PD04]
MTARAVTTVQLDAADAALIVRLIDAHADAIRPTGRQLGRSVVRLRAELERASVRVNARGANVNANVSGTDREQPLGHAEVHAFIDSAQAAAVLGISPGGVRYRARNGQIASRKAGGRWVYSLADTERIAAERARRLRR